MSLIATSIRFAARSFRPGAVTFQSVIIDKALVGSTLQLRSILSSGAEIRSFRTAIRRTLHWQSHLNGVSKSVWYTTASQGLARVTRTVTPHLERTPQSGFTSQTQCLHWTQRLTHSRCHQLLTRPFHSSGLKVAPAPQSSFGGGGKVTMSLGANLLTYFALDLGTQVAGWAYSYWQQTDKYYDLTGSLTYLTLAGLSLSRSSRGPHQMLVTGMVAMWAARLGSFLYARVLHAGKDDRTDRVKSQPGTFLLYWTVQAVWVFVVSLPMLLVNLSPVAPLTPLAYLGAGVWAAGFAIEATADTQKDRFRRDPSNKGKWIDSGLWRYSRHPNYFGEVTLWTGAAMCAATALAPLPAAACFLSPLLSYHLTINVSGLPMVESNAHKRWGDNPAYQAYMRETSAVIPWFRKSNGS